MEKQEGCFAMACNWCGAGVRLARSAPVPCEFCGEGTMCYEESGEPLDAETRDTLTEADITKLVAHWEEKKRNRPPVRMQCNYEHCGRILYRQDSTPFHCTSCGHGTMRPTEPKAHCCECGEPFFDNLDPKRKVICGPCALEGDGRMIRLDDLRTRKRVLAPKEIKALYDRICSGSSWLDVRALEIATGREFGSTAEFHRSMQGYFSRRLTGKPARTLSTGAQIKRKRQALRLSQKQLADLLGATKRTVARWERNKHGSSPKALKWLNAQDAQGAANGKNGLYGEKVTQDTPPCPRYEQGLFGQNFPRERGHEK